MFTLGVLVALLVAIIAMILFVRDETCTQCGHRGTSVRKEPATESHPARYVHACHHCHNAWARPVGWRWFLRARKVS